MIGTLVVDIILRNIKIQGWSFALLHIRYPREVSHYVLETSWHHPLLQHRWPGFCVRLLHRRACPCRHLCWLVTLPLMIQVTQLLCDSRFPLQTCICSNLVHWKLQLFSPHLSFQRPSSPTNLQQAIAPKCFSLNVTTSTKAKYSTMAANTLWLNHVILGSWSSSSFGDVHQSSTSTFGENHGPQKCCPLPTQAAYALPK